MTALRRLVNAAPVQAVVAAWLAGIAVAGCTDQEPAGAKTKCTPGVNVFCRCADGIETGLMECLPGGQSFGACLPCEGSAIDDLG